MSNITRSLLQRSPVLKQLPGGCVWRNNATRTAWFCGTIDKWVDLDGFSSIRVCGSPKYRPGCIEQRAYYTPYIRNAGHFHRSWGEDEIGRGRYPAYGSWLESFGVPCVWVWVEEA